MAREILFTRAVASKVAVFDQIGREMAEKAGVAEMEPPFFKSDGSVNRSEVLRRLLAKADPRLRDL